MKYGNEACDDNNTANSDGCTSNCELEEGWSCDSGKCNPICGDGLL